MNSSKVKSLNQVVKIANRLKKSGKKVVFTNGCFDILHVGHIRLLKRAKSFGDFLIIGLNTDYSVRLGKGKDRPIIPENERAEMLAALEAVDFIVKYSHPTPHEVIKKIMPNILVKGADWKMNTIVGREFAEQTRRVKLTKGHSTTKIIQKLKSL
jgi:D-beta-D-heptose 7-phosphate kinase / D-beta-D-heptose 1-phosphate adenosyltransferase